MKRVCLISSLIFTISLIICLIVILIMALTHNNKYTITDSIVFIESIGEESIKKGMGVVYKNKDNYNYIITNYHVVESNNYLYVYNLENKKNSGKVVYYDIYTDIAIIRVNDTLGLKEAKISSINIKQKDKIYYYDIFNKSIESGTVIDLENEINLTTNSGNSFYNAVSINANIDKGNSGGPVFSEHNEIIGLISLKDEISDIGFYIPIYDVMNVVTKLENHSLKRPNLGAIFTDATNKELLNEYEINTDFDNGVVVLEIMDGYPLNKAGISKGDIIVSVDNTPINNVVELQKQIYLYNIGDTINLQYYSQETLNNVSIVLEK